jgi:dephospho-CoA kinase
LHDDLNQGTDCRPLYERGKGEVFLIIAGLTGGIASGKSTVSGIFREAGANIIDADQIAHEVVQKGKPAWKKIKDHFGDAILLSDGNIDRTLLGKIIFHNTDRKKILNRIVHPFVFQEMDAEIAGIESHNPDAIVILDVPLLIETNMHRKLSEVILVYIPENLQLERLMARDRIPRIDAEARIRSQMSIDEKKLYATILIDNSNPIDKTREKVRDVFQVLCRKGKISQKDTRFRLSVPQEISE